VTDFTSANNVQAIMKANSLLTEQFTALFREKNDDYIREAIKISLTALESDNLDVGRILVQEGLKYLESSELISLLVKLLCTVNKVLSMKYLTYYKLKEVIDVELCHDEKIKHKLVYKKYNELVHQLLKDETVSNMNQAFRNGINFI
jgi:hypothetical protein